MMFAAHEENEFAVSGIRYTAHSLVNAAACLDQYRVCDTAIGTCTGWVSPENANFGIQSGLTDEEVSIKTLVSYALVSSSMYHSISGRGSSAL